MLVQVRWWHFVASHAGIAALVLAVVLAWTGWHRSIPERIIERQVTQVQPGETKTIYVTVPGVNTQVPQIVTAPSPDVRIITSPAAPVVVTPAQQRAAERQANLVMSFDEKRRCVHPDTTGAPDPTCGTPVHPHVELVQNGAGFVRLSSPDDDLQTGPITTRVNHVITARPKPWEVRAGIGVSSLFGGSTYLRGEVAYHPLPRFDPLYVGAGVQRFSSGLTNGYLEVGASVRF
jgi:hypothetical protein